MSEPFVLSWSKNTPPFDRLKTNGNLILHKAESIDITIRNQLPWEAGMLRMVFEVVMVLAVVFCLYFMMKLGQTGSISEETPPENDDDEKS
jgi:hypothetical protein